MPTIGTWGEVREEERHQRAALKRRILEENFLGDIEATVRRRMVDRDAQKQVSGFAEETLNILKSVTHAIAIVYDYGCRRYLRGASATTADAFAQIIRETKASALQSAWNIWGWLLGPTFVIPTVRGGAMQLETHTPDETWCRRKGSEVEAVLWRAGKSYVEVSSEGWRYYDEHGQLEPHVELGAPTGEFLLKLERAPIATFRTDLPGKDWWNATMHRGLVAGSLEACFWWAHLGWVRKAQSGKLLVVKANKERLIAGQTTSDAEMPLYFDVNETDEAEVEAIDRSVSPEGHMQQIRFIVEQCAERYGIPGQDVSFDSSASGDMGVVALQLRREKLAHVHAQQVPGLVEGETQLWPAAVAVARASKHPRAGDLPPPDEIRDMLVVDFPAPEVVTDPQARLELDVSELRLGLTSPAEIMQRRHPELTDEQAKERQMQNLAAYADLLDFIASRNLPRDPSQATQTLAQAQGEVGGVRSGEVRRAQQQQQESP
jgi:hypothetical protein